MTSDPPDLGKGLFGYRKSAVNQILADRDVMLRQAEGRVRAAESKVADLQNELASMKDRTTRMDEQVERLRSQLELLMANTQLPPTPAASAPFSAPTDLAAPLEAAATPEPETAAPWDSEPNAWEEDFGHPLEASPAPFEQEGAATPYDEYGESVASFEGLDQAPPAPGSGVQDDMPMVFEEGEEQHGGLHEPAHLFGNQGYEGVSGADFPYDTTPPEESPDPHSWTDTLPPAPEPMRKVDEMRYEPEDDAQNPASPPTGEEDPYSSMSYGFSLHPAQPDEPGAENDYTEQPVFRGFTEDSFDEPSPSEYIGQPSASVSPPGPAAPDAPEWPDATSQPWAQPSEPSPEWITPQAAAQPSREWDSPPAQPTHDWSSPAPAAQPPAPPESPPPASGESRAGISAQSSDITNRFLTEELKGILSAAEESAARILERARATSEHQVAQSNRLWREVQAELARFSAWREQVDPIIRSVHAKVEGVRTQIEDVPEKIRQALAPMADSISMIDSDLAELSSASTPPLLLTPSGLDPGSPVNDWPIGESGAAEDPGGHAERGGGAGHLAG